MINPRVQGFVSWLLRKSRLQYFPVHVRSGLAAGARWTLYPWTSYWRGTQEPETHRAMLTLGDMCGWNCWDLGAHFGIYTIGLGLRVGPTGQVAAFEPNPLSYERLTRHCRMNHLDWVKTFPFAVSDTAATSLLYTYGNLENTYAHLPHDQNPPSAMAKPLEVRTIALDQMVADGLICTPKLVKIDVEGHGHLALAGAIKTIKSCRPLIIMSFHTDQEVAGTKALLQPLGYVWHTYETQVGEQTDYADFILRPDKPDMMPTESFG